VFIDENLHRDIINNLLTNAVKYSPEGGPVLFNLICAHAAAVLSIQARGIGISSKGEQTLALSLVRN
jgi:signal transduction histidine kinase